MAGLAAWLVLSLFSAPLFVMPAPIAHREPGGAKVQPHHTKGPVGWAVPAVLADALGPRSPEDAIVQTPVLQALH